ncbi:MAG: efflux RND transporter permease subunit, partial [Vicinamibacterales bacterium]
ETPDHFGDIVVRVIDGHPVLVRDVARVEDGMAEAETIATLNGVPTVQLQIRKQSGTNTAQTVRNIKERLAVVTGSLPPGYQIRVVRNQADFIEASIRSVEEHLVVGSILAALVVLLFLRDLRSTFIAAISIPTSIVATFALIWYAGFTLNMLTMLALTLSVGIVIDDAIVVLENIYRFIEEKGMRPMDAAIEATREIGLAVLATTLSLVAIFAPIGFMSGMVGRFMRSFGLTMSFAVMVSLLVAFTLTPMMSARWLRRAASGRSDSRHSRLFEPLDRAYTTLLHWAMAHRGLVAGLAVLTFLSSVPLLRVVAVNFTPQDDQSEFQLNMRAPEGTSLEATELLANRASQSIGRLPEVDYVLVNVASDTAGTQNAANVYVKLKPIGERHRSQFDVMADVRETILPRITVDGVRASIGVSGGPGGGGGGGGQIQFLFQGPDLDVLRRYSVALMEKARTIPGVVDVDSTFNVGKPELSVRLDRPKAADLGVAIGDAAEALRLLVGGDAVTTYNEAGEQYEVRLRAQQDDRTTEQAIASLPIPSSRLGSVALENIATIQQEAAPADIRRLARQRQITMTANLIPGTSQGAVQSEIAAAAAGLNIAPEYRADFAGSSRELNRTSTAFLTAFALSLIFMYLVLAAQFESWLHPVTILMSLPLTLPFALISLILFQQSLNVYSALGLLVLFGVVKKNSILQIDHANQLKDEGLDTRSAIIQASRDRLRPILMTTLAFVAGMIPLVLTSGVGSATNHAIGFVVIGGQSLVLVVTLVVTPVIYSLFDEARGRQPVARSLGWLRAKWGTAGAAPGA